jgi:hypothetical protein
MVTRTSRLDTESVVVSVDCNDASFTCCTCVAWQRTLLPVGRGDKLLRATGDIVKAFDLLASAATQLFRDKSWEQGCFFSFSCF